MPWTQPIVAFLAGYGLMSIVLGLLLWLRRRTARSLTMSAVLLAGEDEQRIEYVLRILHGLWEEGEIAEIVVHVTGKDATRAIATRLAQNLSSIRILPEGSTPAAAFRAIRGQMGWLLDLSRIPVRGGGRAILTCCPPKRSI